jgi:hypothetical protein
MEASLREHFHSMMNALLHCGHALHLVLPRESCTLSSMQHAPLQHAFIMLPHADLKAQLALLVRNSRWLPLSRAACWLRWASR